jgi:hypothetical protein
MQISTRQYFSQAIPGRSNENPKIGIAINYYQLFRIQSLISHQIT